MTVSWVDNPLKRLFRDRSGNALIETAFVMPILVLIILGGVEISRYAHPGADGLLSRFADTESRSIRGELGGWLGAPARSEERYSA